MSARSASILCALLLLLPGRPAWADPDDLARRLVRAYPETRMTLDYSESGLYLLINGGRLLFRPAAGCPSPLPDASDDQPLCSSMIRDYPAGKPGREPQPGFDPGRTRNEALLKHLYGASADEVRANCVEVPFLGAPLLFNSRHGAADALARVAARLEALVSENPALVHYILPSPGAYCWRVIEGSGRLSAHSFGIALDLNVNRGPYWRWSSPSSKAVRDAKRHYPQSIVDAFEAEGFIWGGKWSRYDFMHFEYRPELLPREKR